MGLESGSQAQINGFASIPMKRSFAIDSLFGVGAQTGGEDIFRCPENMVLTGIAGGASPIEVRRTVCSAMRIRHRLLSKQHLCKPSRTKGPFNAAGVSSTKRMDEQLQSRPPVVCLLSAWM
jgi:hypothetical protein